MDDFRTGQKFLNAALLILLLVVGFQATILSQGYLEPWLNRTVSLREMPPWERTAEILRGEELAGHIGFVRKNTPPDAIVILPPKMLNNAYEHIGFMQYMLFPRDIHNCGHDESPEGCVRRMADDKIYILGLDYFPPREAALETKKYLRYDGDLGLFVPR